MGRSCSHGSCGTHRYSDFPTLHCYAIYNFYNIYLWIYINIMMYFNILSKFKFLSDLLIIDWVEICSIFVHHSAMTLAIIGCISWIGKASSHKKVAVMENSFRTHDLLIVPVKDKASFCQYHQ